MARWLDGSMARWLDGSIHLGHHPNSAFGVSQARSVNLDVQDNRRAAATAPQGAASHSASGSSRTSREPHPLSAASAARRLLERALERALERHGR